MYRNKLKCLPLPFTTAIVYANTLAYYSTATIMAVKSFIVRPMVSNIIFKKTFFYVTNENYQFTRALLQPTRVKHLSAASLKQIFEWGQCYKTFFVRNLRIFVIS